MKYITTILLFFFPIIITYSQTDEENLEKYWKFRNNFRKNFVKIGSGNGESVPLNAYRPNYACADFISNQSVQHGSLKWGDAPSRIGFYLMMLSTEYRLLKDQNKDVTSTLHEIYYALEAFNRLDRNAEQYLTQGVVQSSLDGYYIRDDVGEGFEDNFSDYDGEEFQCVDADFFGRNNVFNVDNGDNLVYETYRDFNFPSKDQLSGILPGLAFVAKFVDNEFVKPTTTDVGFNLVDEAKAITDRYIIHLKNHEWFYRDISDPLNQFLVRLVNNGGGDLTLESYPVGIIGNRITGLNYSTPFLIRHLSDYDVTVIPGEPGDLDFIISSIELALFWQNQVPYMLVNNFLQVECYDVGSTIRICPFIENVQDVINEHNINTVLIWATFAKMWDKQQVHEWVDGTGFYYIDLLYALYNDEIPVSSQNYYKQILDGMECDGPYAKRLGPGQVDPAPGGWAAENRWIKPTYAFTGSPEESHLGEYSALDYMLYHNLYYMAFKNQLPSFEEKYACQCNDEIVPASVSLLTSQILAEKKFEDYYEKKIEEMHFLSHDLNINNTGEIVLETDLTICNNSTVTLANNGLILTSNTFNDRKGDLSVNGGSSIIIDDNGLLNVKTGTVVYLNENSILQIKSNGRLKIEDDATLIIEPGAKLIFDENALIELSGNNAVLEIQGNVEITDNAIFTFAGDGFIRWNTTYQPNSNIIAGVNSKIKLQGSGRTDKVLEISNENGSSDCWIPDNLSLFQVQSSMVEFKSNGRLVLPCSMNLIASDFKTSVAPFVSSRGVWVAGQANMLISGCHFYNSDLDGALIYGGNPLKIYSCRFNDFSQVKIDGAGYQLYNCHFTNRSSVEASDIYLPSLYRNGTMIDSPEGISNVKTATTVSIERVQMNSAITGLYGIYQEMGLLNLKCSGIRDNTDGIWLDQGAGLNASIVGNLGGYSTISGSAANIRLFGSGNLNLDNGYNNLLPGSNNTSKIITGHINLSCGGNPWNIPANENKWLADNTIDPNVFPGNPQPNNTYPGAYNNPTASGQCDVRFTDNDRGAIAVCSQFDLSPFGGISQASVFKNCASCPNVNGNFFNNVRMDDAVLQAMEKMELIDSLSDPSRNDFTAIQMFREIVMQPGLDLNDPDVAFLARFCYQMAKTSLQNCFNTGRLTKAQNTPVLHSCAGHYLDIANVLRQPVTSENYKEQFYLELDNALTYYWVGRFPDAVHYLRQIDNCYLTDEDYRLLNYWIASIELKEQFVSNTIGIDEYTRLRDGLPVVERPVPISISPSALVNPLSSIGNGTSIGGGTSIDENVVIGKDCFIGSNVLIGRDVVIGDGVIIGNNVSIDKLSSIGDETKLGTGSIIGQESTIGKKVAIEDNVIISKLVKIGDFSRIDANARIDQRAEIADGSYIGVNTEIGQLVKTGGHSVVRRNSLIGKEIHISDNTIIDNNTTLDKEGVIGKNVFISENLSIGQGTVICDSEIINGNLSGNVVVGSCSSPSSPSVPFNVAHDEIFAVAHAHIYGKMENGFSVFPEENHYFVGQALTFEATEYGSQVKWDFGNCDQSSSPVVTYTFTNPGVYVITLTVSPPTGCTNGTTKKYIGSVSIHPRPAFEVTPQVPVCPSVNPVAFNIDFNTGNINAPGCMSKYGTYCTYSQLRTELCRLNMVAGYGDETSETNQYLFSELLAGIIINHNYSDAKIYQYDFSGNYEVMLLTTEDWISIEYETEDEGDVSLTNSIQADFITDEIICANPGYTFTNTSRAFTPLSFHWLLSDGQNSTDFTPVFDLSVPGEYGLSLVVADSTCSDTVTKSFEVIPCQLNSFISNENSTSGLNYNSSLWNVRLYPNPNNGEFSLEITGYEGLLDIVIFDVQGKLIFNRPDLLKGVSKINVNDLSGGIYHWKLISKDFKEYQRGNFILMK